MARHLSIVPRSYEGNQCDNECIQRVRVPRIWLFGGDYFFCKHFRRPLSTLWNTVSPASIRRIECTEMSEACEEYVEIAAE